MRALITRYAAIMLLVLTGCQSPMPPAAPTISFTRFQPIYMDVSKLDVVEEYKSPMALPNIEHLMHITPAEAMKVWVKDRLRTVGAGKSMQVIIKDAHVTVANLPRPGGLSGFFTASQDQRYDARLEVEMRIYGAESALSEASINVVSERSTTISERESAVGRDVALRRLVFDLMEVMNAELEKNMFQYFGNQINFSHNP